MADDVILLEPGDERAQKIAKAMASPTAGDILQSLKDGPKTSGDLTEILHLPMSTVKYHVENLLDAGVIEIAETRYSVKGREVKVYTLKDQLVIVAPRTTSVKSLLLKYASIFSVFLLATLVIIAMTPVISYSAISPADRATGGFNGSPGQQGPFASVPPSPLLYGTAEGTAKATGDLEGVVETGICTLVPTASPPATVYAAIGGPTSPSTTMTEGTSAQDTLVSRANEADTVHTTITVSPSKVPSTAPVSFPVSPGLVFFAGGIVVLAMVIGYDLVTRGRDKGLK